MSLDYYELIERYRLTQPSSLKDILKPSSCVTEDGFFSALDRSNSGAKSIFLNISIPDLSINSSLGSITPEAHTKRYFEALCLEIQLLATFLDRDREVSFIKLYGASANSLSADFLEDLVELIHTEFTVAPNATVGIISTPSFLSLRRIDDLRRIGFNFITIDQQDFRTEILDAIEADYKALPISNQVQHIRKRGRIKLNIQLSYGMPIQTADSFIESVKEVAQLAPETITLTPFCYSSTAESTKQRIDFYGLPSEEECIAMLYETFCYLTQSHYKCINPHLYIKEEQSSSIGYFPNMTNSTVLQYPLNITGYQIYGIGVGSESLFSDLYSVNESSWKVYADKIGTGAPSAAVAAKLTQPNRICLDVATTLAFYETVDLSDIETRYTIPMEMIKNIVEQGFTDYNKLFSNGILSDHQSSIRVSSPMYAQVLLQQIRIM